MSVADKEHGYIDLDAHESGINGHGGHHDAAVGQTVPNTSAWTIKSPHLRECMAECLAVFVMMSFGLGGTAQAVLSGGVYGTFTQVILCWGVGVLFGIHFGGGVSGGHLNPSITTTLALFKMFPWRKVPGYVFAQVLGSFLAALMIYVIYHPLLDAVDPTRETSHTIFATYPNEYVSNGIGLLTEIFGTALLVAGIFAVLDVNNRPASPFSAPTAVALLVVGIGMGFGVNTGCAINPARDFGPRLMMLCAGWGSKVFSLDSYYFWVPIVGPTIGGAIGGFVYFGVIGHHHPNKVVVPHGQHKF